MATFPDFDISDDYAAHVARGSAEPGIDFKTPYGTPIRAPQVGTAMRWSADESAGTSGSSRLSSALSRSW